MTQLTLFACTAIAGLIGFSGALSGMKDLAQTLFFISLLLFFGSIIYTTVKKGDEALRD